MWEAFRGEGKWHGKVKEGELKGRVIGERMTVYPVLLHVLKTNFIVKIQHRLQTLNWPITGSVYPGKKKGQKIWSMRPSSSEKNANAPKTHQANPLSDSPSPQKVFSQILRNTWRSSKGDPLQGTQDFPEPCPGNRTIVVQPLLMTFRR